MIYLQFLATIFMIVMNTLAIILPLGGLSTGDLSRNLSTLITPVGFTFSIWSVIYIALIVISIAVLLKKITLPKITLSRYICSCLCNGLWIVAWHYQELHLSMLLMLGILASLILIDRSMKNQFIQYYPFVRAGVHSTVRLATGDGIESDKQIYGDNNQNKYRYLARRAFLVYLGWIVVASLLMTLIYAKYQLGIVGIYEAEIGIVSLCAVAGINIATIIKEKNIATALVFVWAMYGISQVNGTMGSPIWWTVHGLGLVMIAAIWREGRKWVR